MTILSAALFAEKAHRGQTDKAGVPYIVHLLRVAAQVSDQQAPAALLHDILEDTPTTTADLEQAGFDQETIEAVQALTRRTGEVYRDYIARVWHEGETARAIKHADLLDHLSHRPPGSLRRRYELALRMFT